MLITLLVVCLIVFIIEKYLGPPEPWRSAFRGIALIFAIFTLLSLAGVTFF